MKNIERDEEIYHKRMMDKRTLQSVGDEYGLSRERIREIVAKLHRVKLREKEKGSRCLNPKVMGDIQWNSVRIVNCLTYYHKGVMEMSIEEFIKSFNYNKMMLARNFGRKAIQELCRKLEVHGYKDIEHLKNHQPNSLCDRIRRA